MYFSCISGVILRRNTVATRRLSTVIAFREFSSHVNTESFRARLREAASDLLELLSASLVLSRELPPVPCHFTCSDSPPPCYTLRESRDSACLLSAQLRATCGVRHAAGVPGGGLEDSLAFHIAALLGSKVLFINVFVNYIFACFLKHR